jgi:hypothetical protein
LSSVDLHGEDLERVLEEASRRITAAEDRIQSQDLIPQRSYSNLNDNELAARVRALEGDLRVALGATNDIKALKTKLVYMVERSRGEKEQKLKAEGDAVMLRKTIKMLSDHIEKLMSHLKHEAASKIRILDRQRAAERRVAELEESVSVLQRKGGAKDRLVLELREGSKILEDQLRLMDDKFLELRGKLDWAREHDEKRARRAVKEAADLRAKIITLNMARNNSGSHTGSHTLSLPDIRDPGAGWGLAPLSGSGIKEEGRRKRRAGKGGEQNINGIIEKLRKHKIKGSDVGLRADWTQGQLDEAEARAREVLNKKK